MTSVANRVAVVIGGGGGVGGGTALALAEQGATVVVADIDRDTAQSTTDEIVAAGGTATVDTVDSTDDASLTALYDRAVEHHGRIEILVNACGAVVDRSVVEATDNEWAWLWELNVMSMVRSVRTALPHLRAAERGHVVLTSSLAGLVALDPLLTVGTDTGVYTTTKHAVLGYGEMLRHTLAEDDIGVTVICPGLVEGTLGVTSARHRPAAFGGPILVDDVGMEMPPGSMPRQEAGRRIVDAIESDRATCFTHPEVFDLVEQVFDQRRSDAAAG